LKTTNRVKERSKLDTIIGKLREYAYLETVILVLFSIGVGYLIDPNDICFLNAEVSYILVLLSIITLFHGFENGMLALGILAVTIWIFYDTFEYVEFLVALMMTLIFSEFHYYWTKKINEAKMSAEYKDMKLDELSNAFYSLKISHDQLEKNYVVKPMSVRNSIEKIIKSEDKLKNIKDIDERNKIFYSNFLLLLEKSFNVNRALIIFKKNSAADDNVIDADETLVSYTTVCENYDNDAIINDYLVDKSINSAKPVYISDKNGDPDNYNPDESNFIASIPSIQNDKIKAVLVIKMMPFMAFNRENLTSISILLEYVTMEITQNNFLNTNHELDMITDTKFRYEYFRLKYFNKKYNVSSIILVLKIDNELRFRRVYEKVKRMLRSLDMVSDVHANGFHYITLLFPLHGKSEALGYLNRLLSIFEDERDKKFDYMTFKISKTSLLSKYLKEDYND
jgi:hypothetical protein